MKTIRTFPFPHVFHLAASISLSLSRLFLLRNRIYPRIQPAAAQKHHIALLRLSDFFFFFLFIRVCQRWRPPSSRTIYRFRMELRIARFRILLESSYVYVYVRRVHASLYIKVRSKKIGGLCTVQCAGEVGLAVVEEREKAVCRQHWF